VEATARKTMLSFVDAFSWHHQMPLCIEDQEKMAFVTDRGLYCYKVMPFGLKSTRATYQRLVKKSLSPSMGR